MTCRHTRVIWFKSHSWRDVLDTTLCDCQRLATDQWFPPATDRNIVESGVKHHNPNPTWFIIICLAIILCRVLQLEKLIHSIGENFLHVR